MMHHPALKLAIDLLHFPSQARRIRSIPLPDGVIDLLRVTAGDEDAIRAAVAFTGRSRETVCEAAAFFAEQVLLFPDADSYRVLGARPEATNGELRHNMTLLLRWLHPDLDPRGERSVFTARVTRAWNDLKTPERRDAYDRLQSKARSDNSTIGKKKESGTQSKKQRFAHRQQSDPLYGGGTRTIFRNDRGGSRGFFRRAFLLLFRRTAH
jgi:hypothetical protein